MGKNAKLKERQKWSHEKTQLDNARKLRGIYFIDPEDKEFKETIKNARKKLETSVAPAMPCKILKNCGSGASNKIKKQNLRVIWKAGNPQDCVWANLYQHIMRAILREKVTIHYSTITWFTIFPVPQAVKNSCSESSGGQGMGKIGENFGVEPDKSQK